MTSNNDNILHDHDGLPHVPLLAVHLVMVLISVNSSSMGAGILIKMRQAILMIHITKLMGGMPSAAV